MYYYKMHSVLTTCFDVKIHSTDEDIEPLDDNEIICSVKRGESFTLFLTAGYRGAKAKIFIDGKVIGTMNILSNTEIGMEFIAYIDGRYLFKHMEVCDIFISITDPRISYNFIRADDFDEKIIINDGQLCRPIRPTNVYHFFLCYKEI